jgi:hypothetical protein
MTLNLEDQIVPGWEDQVRILRNLPKLKWVNHVNEGLSGIGRAYRFPSIADFRLLHVKTEARVHQQRKFYSTIPFKRLSRHLDSIAKRTIRRERKVFVALETPL